MIELGVIHILRNHQGGLQMITLHVIVSNTTCTIKVITEGLETGQKFITYHVICEWNLKWEILFYATASHTLFVNYLAANCNSTSENEHQ